MPVYYHPAKRAVNGSSLIDHSTALIEGFSAIRKPGRDSQPLLSSWSAASRDVGLAGVRPRFSFLRGIRKTYRKAHLTDPGTTPHTLSVPILRRPPAARATSAALCRHQRFDRAE